MNHRTFAHALSCLALLLSPSLLAPAAQRDNIPVVPKWGRFDQTFKSSTAYSDPVRQARFTVRFTSPLGNISDLEGFWDGGRTWRVRFSPDQAGRWTYRTACSDTRNRGLANQSGAFLCTATRGETRFQQHGPLRVARNRRYLEHADGTPFFWLSDATLNGARASSQTDWETYARVRANQKFTAVLWTPFAGADAAGRAGLLDAGERLNPEYFRFLDAKVEALNRAGLLSVIAPFGMPGAPAPVPDENAERWLRYLSARWGADAIAWIIAPAKRTDAGPLEAGRHLAAARTALGAGPHAPIFVLATTAALPPHSGRDEPWIDGVAIQSGPTFESVAAPAAAGPVRVLIHLAALPENAQMPGDTGRVTSNDIRQEAWRSLLCHSPAGFGYAAAEVSAWDQTMDASAAGKRGAGLPAWLRALFLPGAKQMAPVADAFGTVEFWRLATKDGVNTSREELAGQSSCAAASDDASAVLYVWEGKSVGLSVDALPQTPELTWLNPRTGDKSPALAVVTGKACRVAVPGPGDWVLLVR